MDLIKKRAVVCGSTQGIGKSTAIKLAEMGASIVLVSRNKDKLNRVLSELPVVDQSQEHEMFIADFSNPNSLLEALNLYMEKEKTVHILVNNTGGPPGRVNKTRRAARGAQNVRPKAGPWEIE